MIVSANFCVTNLEMKELSHNLEKLYKVENILSSETSAEEDEDQIRRELIAIGKYQADRYGLMLKDIQEKMETKQ